MTLRGVEPGFSRLSNFVTSNAITYTPSFGHSTAAFYRAQEKRKQELKKEEQTRDVTVKSSLKEGA